MTRNLISILQLIRLPNVLTAAADSLAGWLLVGGSLREWPGWLPLAIASMVLYAAGLALNDAFDVEIDRRERPGRPIPSGRVSREAALTCGAVGLGAGPLLAGLSGSIGSLVVAAVLAAVILAYDGGVKRTILGPVFMGTCRALNLLLGMSHAPGLGGPVAWLAAAAFGLFVAGITWISRSETETGRTGNLHLGLTLENVALLWLNAAALQPRSFPQPLPGRPVIPLEGLLVLALVALAVNLAASGAIRQPTPRTMQRAVKVGILALVWIDVGLVAAVRGVLPAVAVAAIWLPAYVLGRWLYST
ncbi:MAG: UbiA family prenyltransferase [Isosphaeraceae bacterium]